MSSPDPAPVGWWSLRHASPKQRVAHFYLLMFFWSGGITAYGGIWLSQQGFTEGDIGIINAVPIALLIVLNLWIGRIADRAGDWKDAIRVLSYLSIIGAVGLFFGTSFWPVLAAMSVLLLTHGLVVPVADAAVMRFGRRANFDFAVVRAFGTSGYILGILITGFLTAQFGPVVFVPLIFLGVLLRALLSDRLPKFRAPEAVAEPGAKRLSEVMRPWFLLPLIGWSLTYGALAILGPFQALLWEQEGISPYWIVILIAIAPVAETVVFLGFKRVSKRFRARHLILISALAMVIRLIGLGLEPGVFWLIPLQMLHAITYTIGFLGCVIFIANWTSEDIAAEAQSFFVVLQQIATAATLLVFGWLSQRYGAQAYFALALACAVGLVLIAISLRLKEPAKPEQN